MGYSCNFRIGLQAQIRILVSATMLCEALGVVTIRRAAQESGRGGRVVPTSGL